jgi:hypothetical protein
VVTLIRSGSFGGCIATLRSADAIKTLRTICGHVRKLIVAGRNFGGAAKTGPAVNTNCQARATPMKP